MKTRILIYQKRNFLFYEIPILQPSTHCFFFSLFTYAKRSLKPTDLPEFCLPKPKDLSKTEKSPVQLQSSTHCLFISLFTYAQRSLKPPNFPELRLPKPRYLSKSENMFVHLQTTTPLQPSTHCQFTYTQHFLKPTDLSE